MKLLWALTGAVLLAHCSAPPPELDDLGPLPPFAMTNQQGKPVTDQALRGTVWAANFLFTSCPTECPPLARATAVVLGEIDKWSKVQDKLAVVSISVDPLTDTPELLDQYAAKYAAKRARWQLLTGDYPAMERLVVQGFMQPIIRADKQFGTPSDVTAVQQPTPLDTAHSLRFVLVDQRGHLRALYGRDPPDLQRLNRAMQWLIDHPPPQ